MQLMLKPISASSCPDDSHTFSGSLKQAIRLVSGMFVHDLVTFGGVNELIKKYNGSPEDVAVPDDLSSHCDIKILLTGDEVDEDNKAPLKEYRLKMAA